MRYLYLALFCLFSVTAAAQQHFPHSNKNAIDSFKGVVYSRVLSIPLWDTASRFWDSTHCLWFKPSDSGLYFSNGGANRVKLITGGTAGTGTVTSIATSGGILGGTITTAGTVYADTVTKLVTKTQLSDSVALRELLSNKVTSFASPNSTTYPTTAAVNTLVASYLLKSDTAAMLAPYVLSWKFLDSIAAMRALANSRLKYTDTANMLLPYLLTPDTTGNTGKVLTKGASSIYWGALSVVGSLQSANHSLYISPTTGDVNAQIDTTHSNNWIVPQDFTKITIDTLQAHTSAGGAIRANSGSAVIAWGAGGGQNITFAGYPITNTGDSVLTTNSSGGLLRYDLRGNYKRIADTTGATGYTTIGSRDKAKDSAINYTNAAITAERTATATLTNKTIIPMTVTAASYTTSVTINADVTRAFIITAQAGALLFNAPTGTLYQFQPLAIRIKDDGTARALTWNTAFRASTTRTLPTTTTLSKTMYILFLYNTTDSKWDILDTSDGY